MVDYKTIVSTTDSKVTLMQWLQALAKEFDNAKITDIAFANDGNSSLTFTFTLTDGTAKTATCKAITLTDDEKTIVSGLVGQVATSADGITFNKAVTFAGNIVAKGNEIHQGYESHLGDESHAGTEIHKGQSTFTDLRADDITATDGQDILSYDGTNTSLNGKGTRPLYNTSELALKSDITSITYLGNEYELQATNCTLGLHAINCYYTDTYFNIDLSIAVSDLTNNYIVITGFIPCTKQQQADLGNIITVDGTLLKDTSGNPTLGGGTPLFQDTYQAGVIHTGNAAFSLHPSSSRIYFSVTAKDITSYTNIQNGRMELHIRFPFYKAS